MSTRKKKRIQPHALRSFQQYGLTRAEAEKVCKELLTGRHIARIGSHKGAPYVETVPLYIRKEGNKNRTCIGRYRIRFAYPPEIRGEYCRSFCGYIRHHWASLAMREDSKAYARLCTGSYRQALYYAYENRQFHVFFAIVIELLMNTDDSEAYMKIRDFTRGRKKISL